MFRYFSNLVTLEASVLVRLLFKIEGDVSAPPPRLPWVEFSSTLISSQIFIPYFWFPQYTPPELKNKPGPAVEPRRGVWEGGLSPTEYCQGKGFPSVLIE